MSFLPPSVRAFPLWLLFVSFGLSGCDPRPDRTNGTVSEQTGPLPLLNRVPDFSLTNQAGQPFGSKDLAGRPYLAAFVFTRCPSICPKVMARMKEIDSAMKAKNLDLQLLSISVDPDNDTPAILTQYAKTHGADVDNWNLLTGDHKLIVKTTEEGFKVGLSGSIDEKKEHFGITHGSHLVLVDKAGTIRGYFRSSEEASVPALIDAMGRL